MSKISFTVQGKNVFTFDEVLEKRYNSFELFIFSWLVKSILVLFAALSMLSYFGIVAISASVFLFLSVLMLVFGVLRIVMGIRYGVDKLKISEILLLSTLVIFGISRFISLGTKNTTDGLYGVISYTSLLSVVLALLFFLRNYSAKALKVVLGIGYFFVSLKVILDMFYVIQALIVALQTSTKQVAAISGLNFAVYMVAIGMFYLLLKLKMKIYFKILSYALLISSLFLLSSSMGGSATSWVVALLSIVLLVIEIVLNYKKIIEFIKSTVNSIKDKRYVSFGINIAIILVVVVLTIAGVYLLLSKLNIGYVGSEFSSFWSNFNTGNTLKNVFGSSVDFGNPLTNTFMKHVGLNFGVLPLLALTSLVGLMVYRVIKCLPKHTEVYLYFILFGFLHSILMPISMLPLLVLAFVFLSLEEIKCNRVKSVKGGKTVKSEKPSQDEKSEKYERSNKGNTLTRKERRQEKRENKVMNEHKDQAVSKVVPTNKKNK